MTNQEKTRESEDNDDPEIQAPKSDANQEREFPDVFYCKIIGKVMSDPVVTPEGDSYERSAIEERGDVPTDKLYSNRALQAVIEKAVEMSETSIGVDVAGTSIRAGMQRLHNSWRQKIGHRPLQDEYYCPISREIIHVPAIDPEGSTYERAKIEEWVKRNANSPLTRNALSLDALYPNNAIKILLDAEKAKSIELMHPSIRRWKERELDERRTREERRREARERERVREEREERIQRIDARLDDCLDRLFYCLMVIGTLLGVAVILFLASIMLIAGFGVRSSPQFIGTLSFIATIVLLYTIWFCNGMLWEIAFCDRINLPGRRFPG